ncbi:MAG: ribonuclease III [Sulfuricellaceae bacterium]|nr:ribonuclease III [Sulfuricellaceae bacterium]
MNLTPLCRQLNHDFVAPALLQQALTHRSYASRNNERLEFLGDSILNCAIAAKLFDDYPRLAEGDLSRARASLVREQTLADIATRLGLGEYIQLGEGELKSGGFRRPSILADALEAVFGAIYLDAGFDRTKQVILDLYAPLLQELDPKKLDKDPKTRLQEYLQGRKVSLPMYEVINVSGEAHDQEFEVECVIPEFEVRAKGAGHSRRRAEQNAAVAAYDQVCKT